MDRLASLNDAGTASTIDISQDVQDDTDEVPGNPGVKRAGLLYHKPSSSGNSSGRPPGTLWPFFTRSAEKQNSTHYTAYCDACSLAGQQPKGVTGKADSMRAHLLKCDRVSDKLKSWAKVWTKDSEPFTDDTVDSPEKPARQSGMQRFMSPKDTPMTSQEEERFEQALLKGTVSANLPFTWIDNEYIQEAFQLARPLAKLPSRKQLAVPLLNKAVLTIDEKFAEGMSKATEGVSVTFDGWTDIAHNHLMAVSVTTSGNPRQIFTHKTIDISASPKTGEKTFELIKEEIELLESKYKMAVIAVVSDAAGEAAKARRLLRAWRPDLLTLDCFSHQFNLSVGDYLNKKKTNHVYMDTVANAIDLASWWIKHSVAHSMLVEKQIVVLGKPSALTLPVVTRWGSHYSSMKQLLRSERSILVLVLEKREELLKSVGNKKGPQELAEKMLDLSANSTFWSMLKVVQQHLGPLLIAVRAVESEQTKLDRVLKLLGYLHQHFSGTLIPKFSKSC